MAVESKGTGSEGASYNKITGIVKVKDVIVNPTMTEATAYGISWITEEPSYIKDTDKGKQLVITFYFRIDNNSLPADMGKSIGNVILTHRAYVDDYKRTSKDGRVEFVNHKGNNVWAESKESLTSDFADGKPVRTRYNGEEKLMEFIRAWGDVRSGDNCVLDTIPAMFKGDFSELKALQKEWSSHKLKVWVGLKDRGEDKFVNVVYPRLFWRVYATTIRVDKHDYSFTEGLQKIIEKDPYSKFSAADIQSITPKIWLSGELKSVVPTEEEGVFEVAPEEADIPSDDLPF